MGLLRWGFPTGRAVFLRLSRECDVAAQLPSGSEPSAMRARSVGRDHDLFGRRAGRGRGWRVRPSEAARQPRGGRGAASRVSDRTCHLDFGTYFVGWGGVDWQWSAQQEARVRTALEARGEREVVIRYGCDQYKAPGCSVAALRFENGSVLRLGEPKPLLDWFRSDASPRWVRLIISRQVTPRQRTPN